MGQKRYLQMNRLADVQAIADRFAAAPMMASSKTTSTQQPS
jgi:hypothetical protein